MGDYAPVIDLDQARRRAIAARLLNLGVPRDRILATRTDQQLADLWTREKTIASLCRLTGHGRHALDLLGTAELQEIEQRAVANLMGSDRRGADQLIYSIAGRRPSTRAARRRQKLAAWDLPA